MPLIGREHAQVLDYADERTCRLAMVTLDPLRRPGVGIDLSQENCIAIAMASAYSVTVGPNRRLIRRQQTIEEALDAAVVIMEEAGVGGLSMSEIARRLGMRQPSLYKYFPSLHAVYDALFARGLERNDATVRAAAEPLPPGVARIRAGARAWVCWAVENPALAQLLVWRPVPGFAPTEATFAASVQQMEEVRADFAEAVRLGQLRPDAASVEALRLYTVVLSGVISQQMANEPGAGYDVGVFSSLTDAALDMFLARYTPPGGPDANPRP
jgi:AcrR family transcriptional regulator